MYDSEFELAERTAREAGSFLYDVRAGHVDSSKGKDIKLSTDKESERIVIDELDRTGISILSEERGLIDKGTDLLWIVDPLDGTANYWRGMRDLCCVSIALWKGEEPLFGIVYRFETDQMFTGIVGEGAWLNGEPIHTSDVANIADAFLMTGLPVHSDFSREGLSRMLAPMALFKKVRLLGTAAVMGSMVASGRADVYSEDGIMLWDIAASTAIVMAAGGCRILEIHTDRTCRCILFANDSLRREYDDKIL